jgi:hypothetical protein
MVSGTVAPDATVIVEPPAVSAPVADVNILFPSIDATPAETLAIVVSDACPSSILPTPSAVVVEAVKPAIGKPVTFVITPDAGVPSAGVVKVGLVKVLLVKVDVELSVTTFELLTVAVAPSTTSPFLTTKSLLVVATEVPYPLGYIKIMLRSASCIPLHQYLLLQQLLEEERLQHCK